MARRRSKAKQQEEFHQALLGTSFVIPALMVYLLSGSLKAAGMVGGICFVMVIALIIFIMKLRRERLQQSGIAEIDTMDGIQFEKYLSYLFQAKGYKTQVTQPIGDYGADLIIQKDGTKTVVQAKRYSKNVGIQAVQEAQAAIAHYGASEGWVVTNSDYTVAAYELAKSNKIRLINREALIEMILALNPETAPEPKTIIEQTPINDMMCPRCRGELILRKGSRGSFYGCSSFPKCRHTKQVEAG